jgi:hypothetical protein
MALVPKETYSAWFSRTSWPYKHFSYLFENPLWSKSVPKGFSLCPYIWLAIFSLLIFRPFVFLTLGVGRGVKALRLGRLMSYSDRFFDWMFRMEDGLPVLSTILGLSTFSMCIGAMIIFVSMAVACWTAGVFAAFTLPFILLVTLLFCLNYANKHDRDRCPVEIYVRVIALLCVICAFVFQPAGALYSFVHLPLAALAGIGHAIAAATTAIWHGIVVTAQWLVTGAWNLRWTLLWAGVGVVILALYGWFGGRLVTFEPKYDNTKAWAERRRQFAEWLHINDEIDGGWNKRNESWYMRFLDRLGGWADKFLTNWNPHEPIPDEIRLKIHEAWRAEQERQRLWDERCRRMTNSLAKLLAPLTWVTHQIKVCCSYFYAVAKGRKKSMCPYEQFYD